MGSPALWTTPIPHRTLSGGWQLTKRQRRGAVAVRPWYAAGARWVSGGCDRGSVWFRSFLLGRGETAWTIWRFAVDQSPRWTFWVAGPQRQARTRLLMCRLANHRRFRYPTTWPWSHSTWRRCHRRRVLGRQRHRARERYTP